MVAVEDIDDDDGDDDALPDGVYYDDDPPTVRCRDCGKEYLEDAPYCPVCGIAPSREETTTPRSRFFWAMMVLTLVALALTSGLIF